MCPFFSSLLLSTCSLPPVFELACHCYFSPATASVCSSLQFPLGPFYLFLPVLASLLSFPSFRSRCAKVNRVLASFPPFLVTLSLFDSSYRFVSLFYHLVFPSFLLILLFLSRLHFLLFSCMFAFSSTSLSLFVARRLKRSTTPDGVGDTCKMHPPTILLHPQFSFPLPMPLFVFLFFLLYNT